MRQQHVDQRPGAVLVAETVPCHIPESLMRPGERPCLSCLDQSGRIEQRTRLPDQDLEVVIQRQCFNTFMQRSLVARYDPGPVEDLEM